MPSMNLIAVNGVVRSIAPFGGTCCQQQITIQNQDSIQNFILTPDTYVINEVRLRTGMNVTAFYDASLPVPLIYPPQYQAVFIGRRNPYETIYAGEFDENLEALDGSLKLNIERATPVVTSNGQPFECSLRDYNNLLLIVYYSTTTRSIPPQTTPRKVIVVC